MLTFNKALMLWMPEEILAIPGVSEKRGPLELVSTEHAPLFSCFWIGKECYNSNRIEMSPSWAGEMAQCLRAATS